MKAIVLASIVLAGCVTAKPSYTPEGKMGQSITCNGGALTWGSCYEKAGEICGARGYTVLERSGEQGVIGGANQQSAFVGTNFRRSMLIQCKE